MTGPIVLTVKRYQCPHCRRNHASRVRATNHMTRCWFNPDARGCKTCINFRAESDACGCEPGCNWGNSGQSIPEHCAAGVDLTGRPACAQCGGQNYVPTGEIFRPRFAAPGRVMAQCAACNGDGAEVKPGPITGCPEWAPSPELTERSRP